MAESVAAGETRDILYKLCKEMKELSDHLHLLPSKTIHLPPMHLSTFVDVTNTVEKVLMEGKRIIYFEHLEKVKAYSCLEACLTLIVVFSEHIYECLRCLQSHVTNEDHVDVVKRVHRVKQDVDEIIDKATQRVEDIGHLVLKIIAQETELEDRYLPLFSFKFNMVVIDLEACSSRLIEAKDHLERIAFKQGFLNWNMATLASTGFGAVALSGITSRVIATIGTAVAALGVATYMTNKLRSNIPFAKHAKELCGILESDKNNLVAAMDDLRTQFAIYDSAKKLAALSEENRIMKDTLASLKCRISPSDSPYQLSK